MAPALTAEQLSTKEKITSVASPSVVVKKPATPTPATATTRVTRSSKEAAATAAAAAKAAAVVLPQRNPSSRISNKRKLSGGNNSSSSNKQQNNDPMGLSTAPTPHTTTTTSTGSVVAEAEAATGAGVPPIIDAAVASTSATGLLESQSAVLQQSESTPSTDVSPAADTIEHNNNNSSSSSPSKDDNSTAQLLADLNSDFVETISAEICLRKTLPEVGLSKEPTPSAVAPTEAEAAEAVAETIAEVEVEAGAEAEVSEGKFTTGVSVPPQIDLLQSMELEQPATTNSPSEELPKIDTDNIEERLSQLDGNASAILVDLPPVQLEHDQVQVEVVISTTPTTPSRQQVQQDPRSEPLPAILASPLPGQRQSTATSALNASQLTPQSTSSSTNFLKDATAGVVLEDPDIEEVLKALKTFEGNHVINPDINTDMCDFNFFNEVWEEPQSATAIQQRSVTPQYPPNSIGGTIGSSSVISPHVPPAETMAECQRSMEQQHQIVTRKIDHLIRRMRKFQARYMCSHTSEEVAGIMEWSARTSHKTPNPVRSDMLSEQEATVQSIVSGRPRPDFWEEKKKHPVPATQMVSILRSIATAARHQQICHTPSGSSATLAPSSTWYSSASSAAAVPAKARRGKNQLDTSATAASTSTAATAMEQKTPGLHEIIPCFDTHITNELTHVSGLLHNEMREIQNAIDSDATESSSGGESADEMVIYNNTQQKSLTIARRAVWTYSKDRASIALRWSWLCSQMADLEGRKRQYRDLYMDLNQAKGAVELEPMQVQQPANGYKEEPSSELQCCRARPLMLSKFRKRSLFQTTGIHTISKKAARPSNIKCGCQWPQIPCALCTGRPDPTAPRELAEMMMPANRVALLDPGYHPVLSFDTDVTQSVHFESISRQADWQHRVSRLQAKTVVKGVYKSEREAIAASNSAARRPGDLIKRRYIRRKERNNNNNNNNSNSNKDAATTTAAMATGLGDSGNGTATSTSSTPSTTPLVANSKLFSCEQETAADTATNWNEPFEHIVARLSPTPTTAPPQSLLSSNSISDLEQRH
ncbi:mucin-5AC isoform X2 [Drosophila obscura]|uniref:mucin-5AC isoform X2 n=1 Tax=Drosophila obscura TaxID=7282 RepID=UPI001BB23721|nr:mucin-5AC isoform X2 [Drosophila obscura]